MTDLDDYYDIEAAQRERFEELDGVGPATAEKLVQRYDLFSKAADFLLGSPNSWAPEIGRRKCDEIRDALQVAGHEPPCDCDHYENVRNTQDCDDVLARCRTCGGVITP